MLREYNKGGFEVCGANGRSNDWRRWDDTPMGCEGFLVDNYYTLLAVPLRQTEIVEKRIGKQHICPDNPGCSRRPELIFIAQKPSTRRSNVTSEIYRLTEGST